MRQMVILEDVLLEDPDILRREKNQAVILGEIQNIEERVATARNRRYVTREIEAIESLRENAGNYEIINTPSLTYLISVAENDVFTFVTNSVAISYTLGLVGMSVVKNTVKAIEYGGITYIDLPFSTSRKELDGFLTGTSLYDLNVFENSYVIIRDTDKTDIAADGTAFPLAKMIFKYQDGEFVSINQSDFSLSSGMLGKITPLNPEQTCLFDIMENDDIKIVSIGGTFGTGKSFLTSAYAVSDLEKKGRKIIYVPNNSEHEYSRELGTLPGELVDKELPYMGTLIDILSIEGVYKYLDERMIEVVPMAIMRGRNFDNATIFVNEAQNLTREQVQLLLGRCGKNTRIFFDGDFKQADADIFRDNNGLQALSKLRFSPIYGELYGAIKLNRVERSKTANAASYLSRKY